MNWSLIQSRLLKLPILALLVVVLLSACSPSVSMPLAQVDPTQVSPALPTGTSAPEAGSDVPPPVATSRGPDLEATDPAAVSLASGGLQLVEFFRFT